MNGKRLLVTAILGASVMVLAVLPYVVGAVASRTGG